MSVGITCRGAIIPIVHLGETMKRNGNGSMIVNMRLEKMLKNYNKRHSSKPQTRALRRYEKQK